MTREEAIQALKKEKKTALHENKVAFDMAIKALEQEPSRDMEEIKEVMSCDADAETKCKIISNILTAKPHYFEKQEPKTKQFAKWVAREIFDEMWEYNKDAFAELACRKLAKLGIVRAKGNEWELVEPQERSDKE